MFPWKATVEPKKNYTYLDPYGTAWLNNINVENNHTIKCNFNKNVDIILNFKYYVKVK